MQAINAKIPKDLKIAGKAGLTAAVFSGLGNSWAVYKGEKEIAEAMMDTVGDGLHAGTSQYLTTALIQNLGDGKYAITAVVDSTTREIISGTSKSVLAGAAHRWLIPKP